MKEVWCVFRVNQWEILIRLEAVYDNKETAEQHANTDSVHYKVHYWQVHSTLVPGHTEGEL